MNLNFTGFSNTHPSTPSTIALNLSKSIAGVPGSNPRTDHSGSIFNTMSPMQPNMGPIDEENENEREETNFSPKFLSAFDEHEKANGRVSESTETNQQIWDKNTKEAKESIVYREVAQAAVNYTDKSAEGLENTYKTRITAGDFGDIKQMTSAEFAGRSMFEGIISILMGCGLLFLRVVASNSRMHRWTQIADSTLKVQKENLEMKRREIKNDEHIVPPNQGYYQNEAKRMIDKYIYHLKMIHLQRFVHSIVSPITGIDGNIYYIPRKVLDHQSDIARRNP